MDFIDSSGYVERVGSHFLSDIEGIHPLLGELEQYVQGGMTWFKSELVI